MNIKPLHDHILVERIEAETKTKGGIIIPDTAQEKPLRGYVLFVGPGKEGNLMTVAEGDAVLYGRYSGHTFKHGDQEYVVMREEEIFCIVDVE